MNVKLSSAGESYLNFSWSDAVRPSCPTLYYKINTTNCGTCPTSTNKTEIQCTGFEVSTERQICKLSVQTVACNNLTGQRSNEIYVTLQRKYIFRDFSVKISSHALIFYMSHLIHSSHRVTGHYEP